MSQVIGEEFGTPDVTDFISGFDPRYDWLAEILDQYLTYVGGPEYTGLGDDRQYLPEEVQEIRELLAALNSGEEIDVDLIRNDYPLLADYIDATYPDITIDEPTLPGQEDQDTGIDIAGAVDSLLDKFPTWEDLWSKVQDQLPDNPQEWGDVIRSVIEAAGVDLPESDIYGILNGGYGVVWNPGGIAGLPSGVGAIIQSGNIFVPGIPVGLPPSSTIIGTIGDYVNAENPIDVFVENVQGILGDVIADPAGAVTGILGQGTDVPTEVWEVLIGGAAATQGVIDWLEENGYISGSEDSTVVPPVGGEEEEEEDAGVQYGPDSPRPDDAFYQEVDDETVDPKDPTQYSTITEDDSTPQFGDPDFPVLIDDTAMGDYEEPSAFDDTTDDDTTTNITYGPDDPRPDDVFYVEADDETTDSKDLTDYGTIVTGEEDSWTPELGGPNPPPYEEDTTLEEDIYGTDGKPIVSDSDITDKDTTNYTELDVYDDPWTPELSDPLTEAEDGGGGGAGSIGGSSDPSRFRKGLTYQLFSPQSVIPSAQRNYAQGLLSSAQRPAIDTPVSKSLFGEFFA